MKIHLVLPVYIRGGEAYQSLEPVSENATDYGNPFIFDGTPKASIWTRAYSEMKVENKRKPAGNFPLLRKSAIVADKTALTRLKGILSAAGELLPLHTTDGKEFTLVNIMPLIDCLDDERSDWRPLPSGKREALVITRYEFIKNKLPDNTSLFKLDRNPMAIFATEGFSPPELEFKAQVEMFRPLTGV